MADRHPAPPGLRALVFGVALLAGAVFLWILAMVGLVELLEGL
jgi:hypothetical protein